MTMDDPVRRALAELAEATRRAPPQLECSVLAAFDRQREHRYLHRCAATVWAHRRPALAVALAAGVTTTIYVKLHDRVSVGSRVSEPPIQPSVGRQEPPSVADARQPHLTPAPSVPHHAPRARTRRHQSVHPKVDRRALPS